MTVEQRQPRVDVVIVSWNGASRLPACLRSLEAASSRSLSTVTVVDNGSTDGTAELLEKSYPWVRVVKSPINLGFAGGNNLALPHLDGDVVMLLNNDAEVDPACVDEVAAWFAADPTRGVAGCVVKDIAERDRVQEAGLCVDRTGFPIPFELSDPEVPPFYASGCALALRRSVVDELGLFDERYFIFAEDLDVCWRYRIAGYELGVVPSAVVYHESGGTVEGGTSPKGRPYTTSLRRIYWRERNTLATLLKNREGRHLPATLGLYLAGWVCEALFSLVVLRPGLAAQYLKALGWNLVNLGETLRRRREVQAIRRVSDDRLVFDRRWGKWAAFRLVGLPRTVP